MADIEGIARRIYDIIISPETVTRLINGGLSIPLDYGYLIYGIFDAGSRFQGFWLSRLKATISVSSRKISRHISVTVNQPPLVVLAYHSSFIIESY